MQGGTAGQSMNVDLGRIDRNGKGINGQGPWDRSVPNAGLGCIDCIGRL
jgi:hypothetical protein